MAIRGWLYIITNKSMPGLLKVGYSTKDPVLRANELARAGLPHQYVVEYDVLIENPRDVEQQVHHVLSEQREGKEWFRCSIGDAIKEIRKLIQGRVLLENVRCNLSTDGSEATAELDPRDYNKVRADYDEWRIKRLKR